MMDKMYFTKIEGLGNDYLYIEDWGKKLENLASLLAPKLCERHFGIGSDGFSFIFISNKCTGLILVQCSEVADFCMRMFNSDGSESEMCGNGIRGFAKYVYDRNLFHKTKDVDRRKNFEIETLAGIIGIQVLDEKISNEFPSSVTLIRVNMGIPRFLSQKNGVPLFDEECCVNGKSYSITRISMGNPHCILFVDHFNFDYASLGKQIENHHMFPSRTNVEFVLRRSDTQLECRVWERGSGETMACGTGACAVAVAAFLKGLTQRKVEVKLRGGSLHIEWDRSGSVYMTGPSTEVYSGSFYLPQLPRCNL